MTAGAGASDNILRPFKRKQDRVAVRSTEGLKLPGVRIQLAECKGEHRGPASGLRLPLQETLS